MLDRITHNILWFKNLLCIDFVKITQLEKFVILCRYIFCHGGNFSNDKKIYIHTFIKAYMHTFILTQTHIFINIYQHVYIHSYLHGYIHNCIHTCMFITCMINKKYTNTGGLRKNDFSFNTSHKLKEINKRRQSRLKQDISSYFFVFKFQKSI